MIVWSALYAYGSAWILPLRSYIHHRPIFFSHLSQIRGVLLLAAGKTTIPAPETTADADMAAVVGAGTMLKPSTVESLICKIGFDEDTKIAAAKVLKDALSLNHVTVTVTSRALISNRNTTAASNATIVLTEHSLSAMELFLAVDPSKKLDARKDLKAMSIKILSMAPEMHDSVVALSLTTALIALESKGGRQVVCRFAASAIALEIESFMQQQWPDLSEYDPAASDVYSNIIFALVDPSVASGTYTISRNFDPDLHIVSALARALNVNHCPLPQQSSSLAARIVPILASKNKTTIAAALTLASQLKPWDVISPIELLRTAVEHQLWHAAERVTEATTTNDSSNWAARTAEALVDAAYYERKYRKADKYATRFFNVGAHTRLLDARFMHACDSIQKIAVKGGIRLMERQAEIIEQTVELLQEYYRSNQLVLPNDTFHGATTLSDAVEKIRQVAFHNLALVDDSLGMAHLANVWGLEHKFDSAMLQAARDMRRATYFQWDELLTDPVPDVLTTPESLQAAFELLMTDKAPCYGFDTEWGEEQQGVALLQLASFRRAILIDIPILSKSDEGVKTLKRTIGKLFADPTATLVGFACKGDVSKLRSSPCVGKVHWLGDTCSVRDLQKMMKTIDHKQMGLSKCCKDYLGKPLDKLEQCSDWMKRPLTLSQRTYAALDAFVCLLVYQKLVLQLQNEEST